MKILKTIFRIVIMLIVALVAIAYLLPREVAVARSIEINAPAADIFPHVNSLKATEAWSPWLDRDPNVELAYGDIEAGAGASMSWASDHPQVGNGSQEITESVENTRVVTALDFGSQGTAVATFELAENNGATNVTWGFVTDTGMNPMARWFGLMMDGFVGPDYETGLSNLKALVEG